MITDAWFDTKKEALANAESCKEHWKYVGIAKDTSKGKYVSWRTNSKEQYYKFLKNKLDATTRYSDIEVMKN